MADGEASSGSKPGLSGPMLLLSLLAALLFFSCSGPTPKKDPDTVYLPTPEAAVEAMLRLAHVTEEDTVYDLGSGDGRIVIAAARDFHARAVGVELDHALVEKSRRLAMDAGLSGRASFIEEDIFKTDLKDATVVTLFLLPGPNIELIPKLLKELKPGSRVVSHMHDMGAWRPDRTVRVGPSTIYLWVVPADVYGEWDVEADDAGHILHGTMFIHQTYQELRGSLSLDGGGTGRFASDLGGGRFAFELKHREGRARRTFDYRARADGNLIEGDLLIRDDNTGETRRCAWTARRATPR